LIFPINWLVGRLPGNLLGTIIQGLLLIRKGQEAGLQALGRFP